MLLCFSYGMGSISESETADPSVYQAKQKGFLEQYQTFELLELQRVVSFLKHLAIIRSCEVYMNAMAVCK